MNCCFKKFFCLCHQTLSGLFLMFFSVNPSIFCIFLSITGGNWVTKTRIFFYISLLPHCLSSINLLYNYLWFYSLKGSQEIELGLLFLTLFRRHLLSRSWVHPNKRNLVCFLKKKSFSSLLLLTGSLISKYQDNFLVFHLCLSVLWSFLSLLRGSTSRCLLTALVQICIDPRWSKLHPTILSLIYDTLLSSIFSLVP